MIQIAVGQGCLLEGRKQFAEPLMKRSNYHKSYPNWRQREMRFLITSLIVGSIAAAIAALVIYFASRGAHAY
jgi:hypothetical protein